MSFCVSWIVESQELTNRSAKDFGNCTSLRQQSDLIRIRLMPEMKTCYLCGERISPSVQTRDHVPPQKFFPEDFRKQRNPNLKTLPTHRDCNEGYRTDEE